MTKFVVTKIITICFSFFSLLVLSGCLAEAKLEMHCVPQLTYIIDRNHMYYSNFGASEKPEMIREFKKHNLENSLTLIMENNTGIIKRKPVEKMHTDEVKLLGPFIRYKSKTPTPTHSLVYVKINHKKTWISLENLWSIASYQPHEINKENNRKINIPIEHTIEIVDSWYPSDWQCPSNKES